MGQLINADRFKNAHQHVIPRSIFVEQRREILRQVIKIEIEKSHSDALASSHLRGNYAGHLMTSCPGNNQ